MQLAHPWLFGACVLLHGVFGLSANAQPLNIDTALNESVVTVPKRGLFTIALETTQYLPDGDGPFPVVIINHGKAYGDPRFQDRYRPALAARYFLQRGYAVVVPMRQGFSKSEGRYIGVGCNIESNGEMQAEDVQATLDYGARSYAGVKGLVNFAGGLRSDDCPGWQGTLARGAAAFAKTTTVPSLWFYGDNDSFFSPPTYRQMFEQYRAAGGKATLVAFGNFGSDSHAMFASRAGTAIWQPELDKFLASIDMPYAPIAEYAKFGRASYTPAPPKTDFAALIDETKIPFVRDTGRAGYKKYLTLPLPRAFAIAPSGAWGWSNEGDDPIKRALETCSNFAKTACKLYSVDEDIVWPAEPVAQ